MIAKVDVHPDCNERGLYCLELTVDTEVQVGPPVVVPDDNVGEFQIRYSVDEYPFVSFGYKFHDPKRAPGSGIWSSNPAAVERATGLVFREVIVKWPPYYARMVLHLPREAWVSMAESIGYEPAIGRWSNYELLKRKEDA